MKRISLSLIGLILGASHLVAWDIPGHMMVAQVAYGRLNPTAKAHVTQLAGQVTLGHHTYNAVNIAAWADEIKTAAGPDHGHYRFWHFIDLGVPESHMDLLTNPDPLKMVDGDVVSALKACVAVARGGNNPFIPNEADAVALIVHLVGDIHQPLHCSSHYYAEQHVEPGHVRSSGPGHDRGGNAIDVSNFPDKYPELHQFWDKAYKASRSTLSSTIKTEADLETFKTAPDDAKITKAVSAVLQFAPASSVSLKPDFEAWAKETHELGLTQAYGKLPGNLDDSPRKLSYSYVKNAHQLAQKRICLAGYRLAALLNELYPEH